MEPLPSVTVTKGPTWKDHGLTKSNVEDTALRLLLSLPCVNVQPPQGLMS
jgi:hypothetical protein